MKRLSVLLIFALLLSACSIAPKPCEHVAASDATCAHDQVCSLCGAVLSPALAHTPVFESCETGIVCSVCGKVLEEPKAHTPGDAAGCETDQVCTVCGAVLAPAVGHTPLAPENCTDPVICSVCGTVLEEPSHVPGETATCLDPQFCLRCGEILTPALGHEGGAEATDTEPQTCVRCGIVMALSGNAGSEDYIDETVVGVHYHNNLDAYYSGAVLVCGDYALEYFSLDETGCSAWANAVNTFAARFPEVTTSALLIPKSCAYNSPAGYSNRAENQEKFIDSTYTMLSGSVVSIDAMSLMTEHSGEYLYYRTDHHWTSLGAYYASAAFCKAVGIEPRALSSYETTVRTGYVGSLYYFCNGSPACLKTNPDYTVCHLPKAEYRMTIGDGYEASMLNTETNAYASAFICGDNAFTRITTNNNTGRNLLIFKESYGNAFVPFMADYFDQIIVLDIRQNTRSLSELISEYGITHALIINNVQGAVSLNSSLLGTVQK